MYYDASSTDYISTPSFAIPNTGILTVEAWMNSKLSTTNRQTILGDYGFSTTLGFFHMSRYNNSNTLWYEYANGTAGMTVQFANFFQNFDNQYIHIVIVCDYANKTLKAYRNGVQFGATSNLVGTPAFPSRNNIKYIGAYNISYHTIVDGSLDDVRIYNRGLSANEISEIYNKTKSKYQ